MNPYTRRTAVVSLGAALLTGLTGPAAARDTTSRGPAVRPAATVPLPRAHAHNDYAHPRPLLDALDHGFGSVEADIWLVDGRLLVGHEEGDLDPARTLRSLYLDPLRRRIRAQGGTVYRGSALSLQLLIDIKTAGDPTYRALARVLYRYRDLLSVCRDGRVRRGPVTAVISGDRAARAPMEAERVRHAFYDGRPEDLGTTVPASFAPLVSASWTDTFGWQGVGPMPAHERELLRRLVAAAHAERRRLRFWATPDAPGPAREAVWAALLRAGVDHLNSDDLAGLERFLRTA
ncbi:phosphatidylinositol-specific phospholipase C/glycerophosphodiester phosphodiesterase family protein [Streptomyces sp. NPDC059649]|uniref:phosphatidylinositol-specific phospholipase C/glycerophosphodiester phosphodiesterase family protein n=1 Tax=Streptomyces sp. NPDC059649 TaxID=3346895 RepID=UPI003679D677